MANIKSINGNPIVLGNAGLEDGAVQTRNIANNAVIGDKLNDGAVRTEKLSDVVANRIGGNGKLLFEQGHITPSGAETDSNTIIRSVGNLLYPDGTNLVFHISSGYKYGICVYRADGSYSSSNYWNGNVSDGFYGDVGFNIVSGVYVRLIVARVDGQAITPNYGSALTVYVYPPNRADATRGAWRAGLLNTSGAGASTENTKYGMRTYNFMTFGGSDVKVSVKDGYLWQMYEYDGSYAFISRTGTGSTLGATLQTVSGHYYKFTVWRASETGAMTVDEADSAISVQYGSTQADGSAASKFDNGWIDASNSVTAINPETANVQAKAGSVKHLWMECKQGDIFEIDLVGGTGAKTFAIVAGPDHETPYAVLSRMNDGMKDVEHKTFVVIANEAARYVLFQNKFAVLPNGYVRKVSAEEYLSMRNGLDFYQLNEHHYLRGYFYKSDGTTQRSSTHRISPAVKVRYGDLIEGTVAADASAAILNVYDDDFNFVYALKSGQGSGTPVTFSITMPFHGWIRLGYYWNTQYTDESEEWAHKVFRRYNLKITPQAATPEDDVLAGSENALERLRNSRMVGSSEYSPLTLLHITDIHGDTQNFRQFAEALAQTEVFGQYIDDAICTGDLVYENVDNSSAFLDAYDTKYRPIMLTVGNHDVKLAGRTAWRYTEGVTIQNTYERYIAPFISEWNVTTDPSASYPTYYYKDYAAQGVRMIVLDPIMNDVMPEYTQQMAWLESTLNDARTNDLAVVAVEHYLIQGTPSYIDCGFTDHARAAATHIGDAYATESTVVEFQRKIAAFKQAGGEFVCWITGHMHADYLYTVTDVETDDNDQVTTDFGGQLCICTSLASTRVSTTVADREVGRGRHLWNAITVSRTEHLVKIVRFGAEVNRWMQRKTAVAIDYQTMEVIGEA